MLLKNESIIKYIIYIVIFVSAINGYLAIHLSQNLVYLNLINIILLFIVILFYTKDIKKYLLINSIYDTQTKLYNRQYFLAELATTYERAIRYKTPLCILMISIENLYNFKPKEKDIVLKEIGASILSHTRESDIVCRYDDTKIAMLLPMTDYLNASIAKDRLKNYLLNLDIEDVDLKVVYRFAIVQNNEDECVDEFLVRCIEANLDIL